KATADEDGWARLGPVGQHIQNQGSFDARNYGFSKLSDLFAAIDTFEVKKQKNGPGTILTVRLRNK
ncbi:OST-HTH/LOTUS domain-containing protein, partial [Pelagicoccus sp. SDUM812003]|uniref:OST-HTH/LOTUS domain-containing protein n=1 Tax=Pelagicoccus sp. SDUM812003 TaxID=3041267 RepID=UPI00280DEB6E